MREVLGKKYKICMINLKGQEVYFVENVDKKEKQVFFINFDKAYEFWEKMEKFDEDCEKYHRSCERTKAIQAYLKHYKRI